MNLCTHMVPSLAGHIFMTIDYEWVELSDIKGATMWKAFSVVKVKALKVCEQQWGYTKGPVKVWKLGATSKISILVDQTSHSECLSCDTEICHRNFQNQVLHMKFSRICCAILIFQLCALWVERRSETSELGSPIYSSNVYCNPEENWAMSKWLHYIALWTKITKFIVS